MYEKKHPILATSTVGASILHAYITEALTKMSHEKRPVNPFVLDNQYALCPCPSTQHLAEKQSFITLIIKGIGHIFFIP